MELAEALSKSCMHPPEQPRRERGISYAAVAALVFIALSGCDRPAPAPITAPKPRSLVICPIDDPDCNPPPPVEFDNSRFGVDTWINWNDNPTLIQDAVDAHVAQVRIGVDWALIQPYNINQIDQNMLATVRKTVADLKAHNISTYITLAYSPPWARYCTWTGYGQPEYNGLPGHEGEPCPTNPTYPPHPDLYVAWYTFVRMMTDSLPDVTDWSVWNEPNSPAFFNPNPGENPVEGYATLVRYAADQIHRFPGHRLLGPELGHVAFDTRMPAGQQDPAAWLYAYTSTVGYATDVVTVHYYNPPSGVANYMSQLANSMRYMPAGIPLWLTEAGPAGTEHDDDGQQARDLTAVYQTMTSNTVPRWQKTFWFSLYLDSPASQTDYSHLLIKDFGLGERRPAFWCLSSMANGTPNASLPYYCH